MTSCLEEGRLLKVSGKDPYLVILLSFRGVGYKMFSLNPKETFQVAYLQHDFQHSVYRTLTDSPRDGTPTALLLSRLFPVCKASLFCMELGERQLKWKFPLRGKDKVLLHTLIPGLFLWDPFSTAMAQTGPFPPVPLRKRG